jgi:polyisoprenoid-binding protein YceI
MFKLLPTFVAVAMAVPAFAQTPAAAPAAPAQDAATADTAQPAPAASNAPVAVKAGDTVFDPAGNTVGTVQSFDGSVAVLATGQATVGIPAAGIVSRDKGPTIGLTKEQVEAQAKATQPK